jgi:anti-anti-sigma factor
MSQITVRRVGDVVVVDLVGRLCEDSPSEFLPSLQRLLEVGERKIVVNLDAMTYINAAGIAQLASARKQVLEREGRLHLCSKRLLPGAPSWPGIYTTEAEAIAAFRV